MVTALNLIIPNASTALSTVLHSPYPSHQPFLFLLGNTLSTPYLTFLLATYFWPLVKAKDDRFLSSIPFCSFFKGLLEETKWNDCKFTSLIKVCASEWRNFLLYVVQLLSRFWLSATPCTAACPASLSFTTSLGFLKLMSTESVMPSN